MIYFDCPDCGYLMDSPQHQFGCEPFHDPTDPDCRIRPPGLAENPLAVCGTCSPMKKRTV